MPDRNDSLSTHEIIEMLARANEMLEAENAQLRSQWIGPGMPDCEAGCRPFTGGEWRHTPGCKHYPDSLSYLLDKLEDDAKAAHPTPSLTKEPLMAGWKGLEDMLNEPDLSIKNTYKEELDTFLNILKDYPEKQLLAHVSFEAGANSVLLLIMKAVNKHPTSVEDVVAELAAIARDVNKYASSIVKERNNPRTQVAIYAGLLSGLGSFAWSMGHDYFLVRALVPAVVVGLGYALGEYSAYQRLYGD